jgi:hypothetical protein
LRTFNNALAAALLAALPLAACAAELFRDDFDAGLAQWRIEAEKPAKISATNGVLDIDTPAGVTLWFKPKLTGPIAIEFDAIAVSEGGANDEVSDLNVFWMANNRDGRQPVYAKARSGTFAEYNDLLTYYVGLGGNRNTTTRFRRYIGDPDLRPMLPEHDLSSPEVLLKPNRKQTIRLVANGKVIEYWRDGERLFHLEDDAPYEDGWFALRTTFSHLRIARFRVFSLPTDGERKTSDKSLPHT